MILLDEIIYKTILLAEYRKCEYANGNSGLLQFDEWVEQRLYNVLEELNHVKQMSHEH